MFSFLKGGSKTAALSPASLSGGKRRTRKVAKKGGKKAKKSKKVAKKSKKSRKAAKKSRKSRK